MSINDRNSKTIKKKSRKKQKGGMNSYFLSTEGMYPSGKK